MRRSWFVRGGGRLRLALELRAGSRRSLGWRWRLRVKRGFLGEHAVSGNPFKRPLVQFEPGAVFHAAGTAVGPYYGRLVSEIAPGMPAAVQNGYTFAVPCRWRP